MDNAKKINDIEQQIKSLEKEKQVIQESCSHKETHVKFQEGTNSMRLFCSNCRQVVGFPTQSQIDKFLNVNSNKE
jgi:hypothetical protein